MNTEAIADIFDRIYETGALIVKPATGKDLARCQEDLASIGAPLLPADYIEFLELANGVSWNGFEFFGTFQVTVKNTGYTLTDIVSYNHHILSTREGLSGRLVLGRFDDDLFVYDGKTTSFQILDQLTLIGIDEFSDFSELFVDTVGPYAMEEDEEEYPMDDEDTSRDEGE